MENTEKDVSMPENEKMMSADISTDIPEQTTDTVKTPKTASRAAGAAGKKTTGSSAKKSTGGSAKKSTGGSAKKSTGSSAKKSTAGTTKKSTTETAKKSTGTTKKSTGTTKKSTTQTRKKQEGEAGGTDEAALHDTSWGTDAANDRGSDPAKAEPMPVQSEAVSLPVRADTRGLKQAIPPMDFPERLTAKGFFTRIGILLLVAAVLLVAALIFYYRPVGYTERICSIRYLYDQATQKTRLIVNGEVKKDVQGPLRKNSSDGRGYTEAAVFESGEMLVVRGEKVLQVISGVVDAEICATGKTIAYLTDEGGLYRLDVGKDSTPKLISKNVAQEPFCISPDGNEVLYVTRTSEVSKMAIDSADGKAPYFQNLAGYRPIAVANECAYLYYIRESDNTLYIYEKKNETAIECGSFLPGSLVFNRDFDQVMFTTENGCRFFEEGKELHFEAFSANERFELLINQRVNQKTAINGVQYLQKTLLQSYCAIKAENPSDPTENAVQLAYLKQNKGVVRVERGGYMDSTEKAVVTDKYVFFISTDVAQNDKHSNLFAAKAGQIEAQRLMADVEEFCPNIDGSRVLYRATQGPLRSMRVGSAPMHLADEVVPGSICVTLDDTFYYRTPDGALYRSSNGAAPEQVMPNVLVAYADAHVAFFATDKGDGVMDVYANYRNRRKSELVFEGYSG